MTGQNGTMRYDMKLVTGKAMVGRAVTSLARPAPPEGATPALATKHSVEMIDAARPGEVGVIVMEGTLDIAAMGNLMGTGAVARGMAGMVLDGAIRDIWDIRRMGLTVYARSSRDLQPNLTAAAAVRTQRAAGLKSRGVKSFRSRRQVCHSWSVPGDSQ